MTPGRRTYQLTYWLCCLIIAGIFLAGFHKVLYPADFALAVYRFHLLPGFLVNITALYLSWLEVVCAVFLLFVPRFRVAALWIALALLGLFTAAIAVGLLAGSAFGCGCFRDSSLAGPMNGLLIVRNAGLMALAGLALLASQRARE